MNDNTTPAASPIHRHAAQPPRIISHDQMLTLVIAGKATPLSPQERHRIFIRYGSTWWIRGNHGFCEITGPDEVRKLDTWRRRLTEGALWI